MAKRKERIPWGSEKMQRFPKKAQKSFKEKFLEENCPDCGTLWESFHLSNTRSICDVEECPICGGQLMTCGHKRKVRLPKPAPGQLTF